MEKAVKIDVKNGYEPQTVAVPKGVTTKLVFNRTNPSSHRVSPRCGQRTWTLNRTCR